MDSQAAAGLVGLVLSTKDKSQLMRVTPETARNILSGRRVHTVGPARVICSVSERE
jgi:hypothetical protein